MAFSMRCIDHHRLSVTIAYYRSGSILRDIPRFPDIGILQRNLPSIGKHIERALIACHQRILLATEQRVQTISRDMVRKLLMFVPQTQHGIGKNGSAVTYEFLQELRQMFRQRERTWQDDHFIVRQHIGRRELLMEDIDRDVLLPKRAVVATYSIDG